jgi:hypothetical protein
MIRIEFVFSLILLLFDLHLQLPTTFLYVTASSFFISLLLFNLRTHLYFIFLTFLRTVQITQ